MTHRTSLTCGSAACERCVQRSLLNDARPVTAIAHDRHMPPPATLTHCPYCSLQCGIRWSPVTGRRCCSRSRTFPTNRGGLCSKGWTAADLLDHPQRLLHPAGPRRSPGDRTSPLRPATWDEALDRVARGDRGAARQRYGPDGVGVLRRRRPDQREGVRPRQVRPGRAADRDDRLQRPVLHVVGGDRRQPGVRRRPRAAVPAGRHRRGGGDPAGRRQPGRHHAAGHAVLRRRPGGRRPAHRGRPAAHRHRRRARRCTSQPLPGTDLALANGLLHIAIREGLVDEDYIAERTTGFDAVKAGVAVLLAGPGGADHRRRRSSELRRDGPHPGHGAVAR